MSKRYLIQCPICKTYHEANAGLFGTRAIDCTCGFTINIKDARYITKECPHCGNMIVCDQKLGNDATCPVCDKLVNAVEDKINFVEINCPHCNAKNRVYKDEITHTCEVCGKSYSAKNTIAIDKAVDTDTPLLIKYDGDELVSKHPLNRFPIGSQVVVHEGQYALFIRDGQLYDQFSAGRHVLDLKAIPLLGGTYPIDKTVESEVYYISTTPKMGIKWGTDSKVRLFDPNSGLSVDLGACGTFSIYVNAPAKFLLNVVGNKSELEVSINDLNNPMSLIGKFKNIVITNVKAMLARTIRMMNINVLAIDEKLIDLSNMIKTEINGILSNYGLEMKDFYINSILTPDDDPNFKKLKEQYAERFLRVNAANIDFAVANAEKDKELLAAQIEAEKLRIKTQAEADAIKMKENAQAEAIKMREIAEAEGMKAKGYTYQDETNRMVSMGAVENDATGAVSMAVGLAAMKGVNQTVNAVINEALNPAPVQVLWDCKECGEKGNKGNFCGNCGAKHIVIWDCSCGEKEIKGNFCPNCGAKRP